MSGSGRDRTPRFGRRRLLVSALSALGLAGCLERTDYQAGDLVVENDRAESAAVTVSVQFYREEPDRRDGEPAPGADPDRRWSDEFHVGSGESVYESAYVEEVGTYYVSVSDGLGNSKHSWVEYGSAVDDGISGSHLVVHLDEGERLSLSAVRG